MYEARGTSRVHSSKSAGQSKVQRRRLQAEARGTTTKKEESGNNTRNVHRDLTRNLRESRSLIHQRSIDPWIRRDEEVRIHSFSEASFVLFRGDDGWSTRT